MAGGWKHEELQHDLARNFAGNGEAIIERLSLGAWGSSGQMDVFRMRLSRANPNPTAYEVKVSRSDFMADTQKGKYRRYLPYVRRLYFAAPSGLLKKTDVPQDCGLIVRGDSGWSVTKAATVQKAMADDAWLDLLMSIVLKLHPGPWTKPDHGERIRRGLAAANQAPESLRHLGLELSAAVSRQIDNARTIAENNRWARRRLAERLGLSDGEASALDIASLAERVLAKAPTQHGAATMVERGPVERVVRDLGNEIRRLTLLRDGIQRALPNDCTAGGTE